MLHPSFLSRTGSTMDHRYTSRFQISKPLSSSFPFSSSGSFFSFLNHLFYAGAGAYALHRRNVLFQNAG